MPTGTNLLGLVKHLAFVEFGYFGDTFGRPSADQPAWDVNPKTSNLPSEDPAWWRAHYDRVERIAREAAGMMG